MNFCNLIQFYLGLLVKININYFGLLFEHFIYYKDTRLSKIKILKTVIFWTKTFKFNSFYELGKF